MISHVVPRIFEDNPYRYTPSLALSIIFIVVFLLLTIPHTYLVFKSRFKWMAVVTIFGLLEIIGWAGRIWSRQNLSGGGYKMQISCLIIAPTFLSAALYVQLGLAIKEVAPHKSKLSRRWFNIIFITADVFSLVIQAVGGGIASASETDQVLKTGSGIILAGIIIQLAVMVFFVIYLVIWSYLARSEINASLNRKARWFLIGILLASLLVIVRGIFRTAELSQGFRGYLATHQLYFLLDAVPVAVAATIMLILHPHFFFSIQEEYVRNDIEKIQPAPQVNLGNYVEPTTKT